MKHINIAIIAFIFTVLITSCISNRYYNQGINYLNNLNYEKADSLFATACYFSMNPRNCYMYALTQLFCGDTCHAYYLMTKVSKYEAKRFRIKYEKTDTIRYFQSTLSSFADYSVITNNICSKKKRQIFYKYSKYLNQYNSFILRDSTHKEIILERGREIYFNENYILYLGGDCSVDIHPYFPGGDDSLKKYIENKLRYPQYAKTHHYQGTVYVEFTVDNNGKVKDVILSMGKEEHLDNEALRVISLLPDWTPGIVNNKYVSVLYIIPIRFEL